MLVLSGPVPLLAGPPKILGLGIGPTQHWGSHARPGLLASQHHCSFWFFAKSVFSIFWFDTLPNRLVRDLWPERHVFVFFYVFVFFDSLRNPTKLARILRNLSKLRRLRRSLADFVGFRRFRMISLYFLWFRRIYIDFVGLRERNKNSKEKCNKNKKKHKTVLFRTNKTFLLRSASLPLGLVAARPRCLCWVGPFIYLLVLPRCWGLGPLNIGAAMPDLGCWHTSILVFFVAFYETLS